jgi:peptidyl-prolyl cis-trans isomerase C
LPVNMRKNIRIAWTVGACLVSSGCSSPKQKAPEPAAAAPTTHGLTEELAQLPLVRVADDTVTLGEFAETIAEKSPYLRARYASPERRRELLDELVKFELLAREAHLRGLDSTPDVDRARRQVMVQQMMKAEFEDKVKLADVSDTEARAYYDSHAGEFHKPAQVRVSQLFTRDEAKARKLLKQLLDKADDHELFRELVRTTSEDSETKQRDGDLAFFSLPKDRIAGDPDVPNEVAEAAFALANIGDLAPEPVRSPRGFHIIKLTGKRKALDRTFEQAQRTVQNKLWREKRDTAVANFMEQLRADAGIEEDWSQLAQIQMPIDPQPPEATKKRAQGALRSEP